MFAQIEALAEDVNIVPLFARCQLDPEEPEFLRAHRPVWSAILALQTERFKNLVAEMKLLWSKRDAILGETIAEQERCSTGNVNDGVLAAKRESPS